MFSSKTSIIIGWENPEKSRTKNLNITGDYNNDDQNDDEVEYENDDAELSRPNYNTGFGFEVNPRLTQSNKKPGFGFRRTTFLTSAAGTPSERPLFVKKSTKPATPVERPAVLGPTFVGLDFLTRPESKTGGPPRQNNGFSTKPAPIAERPAVLGPTFVGLDFLTRPAPKTGGDPRQNNGFSTKPAPTADRPAVLGPTFVGLDFLTRPVPSNNAKSPRKNDDFTGDGLFLRKVRHGPIDIINGSTNHIQEVTTGNTND